MYVIVLPAIMLIVAAALTWRIRIGLLDSRQDAMLKTVSNLVDRQLPLAPGLFALGSTYSGLQRDRTLAMVELLNRGIPLADVMDRFPGIVCDPANAAIRIGSRTGDLSESVDGVLRAFQMRRSAWDRVVGQIMYLSFIILMINGIVTFMLFWIIPKFKTIFSDFGLDLPPVTLLMVTISDYLSSTSLGVFFVFLATSGWFLGLGYVILSAVGALPLRPSFLNRLTRRVDRGTLLRSLADGIKSERPATEILEVLAQPPLTIAPKHRLENAVDRLKQGQPLWDSLEASQLIRPVDAALLASAHRAGNEVWAMRELADATDRRIGYRLYAMVQVLGPLTLVGVGALVGLFAVGYFAPLAKLIWDLGR